MSRPTTIGHNLMPPNNIMSRDGSGRPAFVVAGAGVQRRSPFSSGEGSRGRGGPGRA